jgi:hypothetical protein
MITILLILAAWLLLDLVLVALWHVAVTRNTKFHP